MTFSMFFRIPLKGRLGCLWPAFPRNRYFCPYPGFWEVNCGAGLLANSFNHLLGLVHFKNSRLKRFCLHSNSA